MSDQADTLRKIMSQKQPTQAVSGRLRPSPAAGPRVISVASGKGGVGKSCFSATLGTSLARSGKRVLLVDGDFGLANLDILLDVRPVATLEQVLTGRASVQEAIVGVEPNLWLVPAASGLIDYRGAALSVRTELIRLFERLPWEMDFILIDGGSGVQENVLSLHSPEFESLVMLTPEPTALADAYGLIKRLRMQAGIQRAGVVVNQVTDGREGQRAFQKLKEVAVKFMDVRLDYLGHWEKDEKIGKAVMSRKILLDLDPGAASIPSLQLLAKRFQAQYFGRSDDTGVLVRSGNRIPGPLTSGVMSGNTAGFFKVLLGEVKA